MKRVFLLTFIIITAFPLVAKAVSFRAPPQNNNSVQVNKDINDDLYVSGANVGITSKINGDVFVAGGSINFSGSTTRSLFALGGNNVIGGQVAEDLRITGGNITIASVTGGDLLVFGGTISLTGGQTGRDLLVSGANVNISAPVGGKALINGNDVFINAPIKRSVQIQANNLKIGPKAVLESNLSYRSPNKAVIGKGAVIKGKTTFQKQGRGRNLNRVVFALMFFLIRVAGLILLGLALAGFLPVKSKAVVNITNPWASLGLGFAVLVSVPVAIFLLFITVIGWPFAIVLLAAYVLVILLATAYAGIILGSLFSRYILKVPEFEATWLEVVIGIPLLALIGVIPVIGWLIWFILFILALGKIVQFDFHLAKKTVGKDI